MKSYDRAELINNMIPKILDIEKKALDKVQYPGKSVIISEIIKVFNEEYSKYEDNETDN